ncbi:Hypothetical protein NTJ_01693 [Nesidiocoris tenuis]|uniref:VPS9 domain-containing protein n=1 Tax=Nesidiocoris tenuis TaxID=355587 RepID=A0ABN7A997_9HEMI|nr:Hypothetical protein NTJ_01693 [Nesidiocoris tenuis]
MCRDLFPILSIIVATSSVLLAEVNVKEINNLLDVITKNEGFLLTTLGSVVNEIRKTVNEEVYEIEKIGDAAGKCAADIGQQAIAMTENAMAQYVQTMLEKMKKTKIALTNHKTREEEFDSARKETWAEKGEMIIKLAVLRDEVLLPEANRLARKMEKCREMQ